MPTVFETMDFEFAPQSEDFLPNGQPYTFLNKYEILKTVFSKATNECFMHTNNDEVLRLSLEERSRPTLFCTDVKAIGISHDGLQLGFLTDGKLVVTSLTDGQEILRIPKNSFNNCYDNMMRFSQDDSMVAVAFCDGVDLEQGQASLWDVHTGKLQSEFEFHDEGSMIFDLLSIDGLLHAAIFRAEYQGRILKHLSIRTRSITEQKDVSLFDLYSGQAGYFPIVSSANNRVLLGHCSYRSPSALYDTESGQRLVQYQPGPMTPRLAFSPDGKRASFCNVTTDSRHGVFVHDALLGEELSFMPCDTSSEICYCAFSPDGKMLVTLDFLSGDEGAIVWEVESGTKMANIPQHWGHAIFTSDGEWLVSGGALTKIIRQ